MSQQMDISGGMTPLLKYVRIRLEIQTYHSAQGYIKVLFPSKKVDKSKWGMSLYHRIHDWTDYIGLILSSPIIK